ncbi:hypothetical protein CAPTEDRAFT_223095 [Capitella teleta]|uniref:Uncharacterized protein n=1 Tax=Capitella teleta TaxID=283909 RepID=R7V7K3_CAPTE|nr:hypothetical protein CAPTEDRAFT_223095 [Capitella teleta]|eukprot:ELU11715.1 hypothetical protein CAPTEDRAFT_223095 [Capitella teleta]
MAKFATQRSGSRFVVGREAWKSLIVSRVMYASGALVWNENVRQNVERMQNEYGWWMWRLKRTVRNAVVHGESGWSSFWEREMKAKVAFVVRVLEEDGLVARVGESLLDGDTGEVEVVEEDWIHLLEIEDILKEKLERQIVTVPKQRHFNPINLNLNLLSTLTWNMMSRFEPHSDSAMNGPKQPSMRALKGRSSVRPSDRHRKPNRPKTITPFSRLTREEKNNLVMTELRKQPPESELHQYSNLTDDEIVDILRGSRPANRPFLTFYDQFSSLYNQQHNTDRSGEVGAVLSGAAILKRAPSSVSQVPPPQIVSSLPPPNLTGAPPPLIQLAVRKETRIEWLGNDAYVGNLFINKIKLDAERVWSPEGVLITETRTLTKSFEELVSVAALDSALIMTDSTFEEAFADGFISHFPPEVELCIIADRAENANTRRSTIQRASKRIFICKECSQCGWLEQEEPGCPNCYAIRFVLFPSAQLHPNLILLRFKHCLRVIITSASLRRRHWEEVVQLGWTADFPLAVDKETDETSWVAMNMMDEEEARAEAQVTNFGTDLEGFLKDLQIDGDHLLTGIDFSVLSPCVRLITSKLGAVSQEESENYAVARLKSLISRFPWKANSKRDNVCVSHRLGLSNDTPLGIISDIFRTGDRNSPPFKLLYPSEADAKKHCSEVDGLTYEDLATDDTFIDFDILFHSHPFLHSSKESLVLHANALLKYEDITDDSGSKRLGWFMFGSQVLGLKSWGDSNRRRRRNEVQILERMELGVGVFPHIEETDQEYIAHVLDLNTMPLPFDPNALERYQPEDFAFWPMTPSRPADERPSICLGRFRRAYKNSLPMNCGFLEALDGPLSQYSDPYEDECAFVRPGLWKLDPDGFPPQGSVVQFAAYFQTFPKKGFRATLLLKVWPKYCGVIPVSSQFMSNIPNSTFNPGLLVCNLSFRDQENHFN